VTEFLGFPVRSSTSMTDELVDLQLPMAVLELLRNAGLFTVKQIKTLIELCELRDVDGIDTQSEMQVVEAVRRCQQERGLTEATRWEPICSPPPLDPLPSCLHRGDPLRVEFGGRAAPVHTAVQVVYRCGLHGECAEFPSQTDRPPAVCSACDDQSHPELLGLPQLNGPANLLWYVWPRRATRAVWEAQQQRIGQAIHRFDGRKVCVISVDESADPEGIDRRYWDEIIQIPNEPAQREVPGWRWLMNNVSREPGFTVWLHAKGVCRGSLQTHLRNWWELAYESLLDVETVRQSLQQHVIAGVFRRNDYARNLGVPWHYSGSFYAFRNDWIFKRDWQPTGRIDPGGWYAEAWPALIAPRDLTTCLRFEGSPNLYYACHWRDQSCN